MRPRFSGELVARPTPGGLCAFCKEKIPLLRGVWDFGWTRSGRPDQEGACRSSLETYSHAITYAPLSPSEITVQSSISISPSEAKFRLATATYGLVSSTGKQDRTSTVEVEKGLGSQPGSHGSLRNGSMSLHPHCGQASLQAQDQTSCHFRSHRGHT